jgi:MFS transporter, MHS family, shikimate and dehydroshikimate transport protein
MSSTATIHEPQTEAEWQRERVKVALASMVGIAIEWYDFFLYGTAAAIVFNKLFFPEFDPLVGTILAFSSFAIGFVARPVGGVVFGHFGDRIGRKLIYVITLLVMGIGTALVGLLPSYASVVLWAPVLLVTLRVVQGFGLGGAWGGAVLMAVEHAPQQKRGLYGSLAQLGAPLGLVLGTVVFGIFARLPQDQFMSWGWRIPFLLSIVLVFIGLWVRTAVTESPVFEHVKETKVEAKLPVIEAIVKHPKNIILAMGVRFAENGLFYIYATFVFAYATQVEKLPRAMILDAVIIAAFIESLTIPFFGYLSDKLGRRPVYMFGAVFSGLWAFPFFWLMGFHDLWLVTAAVTVGLAIGHAAMYGPQASLFSELFSARVRYSGASLGYQLASIFAGALTPVVATSLLAAYKAVTWPVAAYMVILALITVVSLLFLSETYKKSEAALDDEAEAVKPGE